jgi:signal transduction histidine kinase
VASVASVAERAAGLGWLRPSAAAVRALTADLPDVEAIVADPMAVAHVLRYSRPTASPTAHPFNGAGLYQPSLLTTAADLLEHTSHLAPPPCLVRFSNCAAATAGRFAVDCGLDPVSAAAVAGLTPLGWFAAAAVEPISCAEVRFRLSSPEQQKAAWGLDAVAIGRRVAGRWRLPEWVTTTLGLLRLSPTDAARAGVAGNLFATIQRAVSAVEAEFLRLGLTDRSPTGTDRAVAADVVRTVDPPDVDPGLPDWAVGRLLRAVADGRRRGGQVWLAEADGRADRLADALAGLRADWEREVLQARLAGLAEFAAGASHEINNPLAVIAGHAQLLAAKELDPDKRRQLKAILRQTDRIHDLLRGTLYFARPPAARTTVVSLTDLFARIEHQVAADCESAGVLLRVDPYDACATGDAEQLQRAVTNLLRNALDASSPGGEVRLWAEPRNGSLVVCVADDGPGPLPAQVPHLFDPFFSGRSAGRGRGLGLSVAWRLAEQNGGRLKYDPTPSQPSRFTLTLPQASAARRSA